MENANKKIENTGKVFILADDKKSTRRTKT